LPCDLLRHRSRNVSVAGTSWTCSPAEKSHVFGHSYSAHVVLDLVAQSPDRVKSAVVAEHVSGFQTEAEQRIAEALAPAIERYESGDREGAAAAFLTAHGAPEDLIDQISPGWIDTFFQVDLPALITWDFDPAKLKDSAMPIAWMHSSEAVPLFREAGAALQKWAPGTQEIEMADSDHFFPVAKPAETAAALHEWLMSQDTTD
jgi:pimeloyl-ACP methyl ester carboxylesterase